MFLLLVGRSKGRSHHDHYCATLQDSASTKGGVEMGSINTINCCSVVTQPSIDSNLALPLSVVESTCCIAFVLHRLTLNGHWSSGHESYRAKSKSHRYLFIFPGMYKK